MYIRKERNTHTSDLDFYNNISYITPHDPSSIWLIVTVILADCPLIQTARFPVSCFINPDSLENGTVSNLYVENVFFVPHNRQFTFMKYNGNVVDVIHINVIFFRLMTLYYLSFLPFHIQNDIYHKCGVIIKTQNTVQRIGDLGPPSHRNKLP